MDHADRPLPQTMLAWQCIGCGRRDGPAACVGICQDRKVELVTAADYADIAVALDASLERVAALEVFVGRIAHVTPREGAWEQTYLALQREAREMLTRSMSP